MLSHDTDFFTWFLGFRDAVGDHPTKEQWAALNKRADAAIMRINPVRFQAGVRGIGLDTRNLLSETSA